MREKERERKRAGRYNRLGFDANYLLFYYRLSSNTVKNYLTINGNNDCTTHFVL